MHSDSAIQRLAAEPAVQRLAAMSDELLEMFEKTDPLRAQIVKDYREWVAKAANYPGNVTHGKHSCVIEQESTVASNSPKTSEKPVIDIADQIRRLADLKAEGLLTEEEFTVQKRKLLGL